MAIQFNLMLIHLYFSTQSFRIFSLMNCITDKLETFCFGGESIRPNSQHTAATLCTCVGTKLLYTGYNGMWPLSLPRVFQIHYRTRPRLPLSAGTSLYDKEELVLHSSTTPVTFDLLCEAKSTTEYILQK